MKKRYLLLIIPMVLGCALAGCGNESLASSENSEISGTSEKEEDIEGDGVVTISYGLWGGEERQKYTIEQVAEFEERYPYINVDLNYAAWDVIQSGIDDIMAEGRESDVMQINYNWLAEYSADGNRFYDMKELSDIIEMDAFSDLSLSFGKINGKQNAIPIAMNTAIPVYDKTLYDKYGLYLPESMDELYEAAKVMSDDGIYQLGMGDNHLIMFLFGCYENEYGISAFDDEGEFNLSDDSWTYIANTYKKLLDSKVICPRSEYSEAFISTKRLAGVVCWINYIEQFKADISAIGDVPEVGKFLWTDTDERLGNYVKPATMLAISANTEHPKEAAMLVEFLLNDETAVSIQGVEKGVPDSRIAQRTLMQYGELNNDTFYATLDMNYYLEYMNVLPEKLENSDVYTDILDTLDAYVNGISTLEETVATLGKIR